MRPQIELDALNKEVLTSKKDVIDRLNYLMNETSLEDDNLFNLNELLESLERTDICRISSNLENELIDSYFIDISTGSLYKAKFADFMFEYSNADHELYVSSFSIYTEDEPIL